MSKEPRRPARWTKWTDEQKEQYDKLRAQGLSVPKVAKEMDIPQGAVAYRRSKLLQEERKKKERKEERNQKDRERRAKKKAEKEESEEEKYARPPITIHGGVESWMCRWPLDEPGRFGLHICGRTAQPGRHYCAKHLALMILIKKRHEERHTM